MRIAEDEHLASLHLLAEMLHIHPIGTIHHLQRIGHQRTSASGIQPREWAIYRRLNQHLVTRICKCFQGHTQSRDNTWHKVYHFLFHFEAITTLIPLDNGLIITVRLGSIAQHWMFQTLANGFGYKRCSSKIHIGHPKWNQVIASPNFLHIIKLYGRCTVSIYYFIKIIFHVLHVYSFSMNKIKKKHSFLKKNPIKHLFLSEKYYICIVFNNK